MVFYLNATINLMTFMSFLLIGCNGNNYHKSLSMNYSLLPVIIVCTKYILMFACGAFSYCND